MSSSHCCRAGFSLRYPCTLSAILHIVFSSFWRKSCFRLSYAKNIYRHALLSSQFFKIYLCYLHSNFSLYHPRKWWLCFLNVEPTRVGSMLRVVLPIRYFTRQILTDENAEKVSHFSWQARKKWGTTSEGLSLPPHTVSPWHCKVYNDKLKSP